MSQFQVTSSYFRASGASAGSGVYTAVSGFANLFDVLIYQVSGGAPSSNSGLYLAVFDSVSGLANVNSGAMIWSFNFGAQSGLAPTSFVYPPQLVGLDLVVFSGIVIQTNNGWIVETVYSK